MGQLHSAVQDDNVYKQCGPTCWANAAAQAIISTEIRITGRKPNEHEPLVKELIKRYGKKGQNTCGIVQKECKNRYLSCKSVNMHGAIQAVKKQRVVIISFRLSKRDWKILCAFISENSHKGNKAIIKRDMFNNPSRYISDSTKYKYESTNDGGGHAVVATAYEDGIYDDYKCDTYWQIKNSWGTGFGDQGYFYVAENAFPWGCSYIDVFFRICDLPPWEKIVDRSRFSYSKQQEIKQLLETLGRLDTCAWFMDGDDIETETRKEYLALAQKVSNGQLSKEIKEKIFGYSMLQGFRGMLNIAEDAKNGGCLIM